ncbi:biliverdin-producing heme oxygenase [Rhizobium sp. FKL33]|uniref:biliverdin-producing heme oxygenase n=1 Tax=Rhizobium sp. FKL33 TaxID=2562307 RepID=UPI0010BFD26D|nr:biliverdin-producing heme oxygenase [Rhizobium sp. FKL33]
MTDLQATLRFHLRRKTADLHHRLDTHIGAFRTRVDYGRYLQSAELFRRLAEPELTAASDEGWFGDWRPGLVHDALAADLGDCGLEPAPGVEQILALADPAAAWGALYVAEGASLGANILLQSAEAIGFSATRGARHLAAQSRRSTPWPRFTALLDSRTDLDPERMVDGARMMFETALACFDPATGSSNPSTKLAAFA